MRRGFTLIELLVVMAIIAILASLLFPVFSRAREKARQVVCLSNIRQLSMTLMAYAQDYGEGPYCPPPGPPGGIHWAVAIEPYIRNEGIFVCPTADENRYAVGDLAPPGFPVTYGINEYLVSGRIADIRRVDDPSSFAILADSASTWSGPGYLFNGVYYWEASPGRAPTIHNDGAIFTFADSHAKWHRPTIVSGAGSGYTGDYYGLFQQAVLMAQ